MSNNNDDADVCVDIELKRQIDEVTGGSNARPAKPLKAASPLTVNADIDSTINRTQVDVTIDEETDKIDVSFGQNICPKDYVENIKSRVQNAVNSIDTNIESMTADVIRKNIELIVMNALGFRQSWSNPKWEIDNSRNSSITSKLSLIAQNRANVMVDLFIEEDRHLFISKKLNDQLKKDMNTYLGNRIQFKVQEILRSRIDEIATERANHIIDMAFDELKKK